MTTELPDTVEAAPFESMTRAEMREHLIQAHRQTPLAKATRIEMGFDHDQYHRTNRFTVAHAHIPPEQETGGFTDQPLSPTEQRNLTKLVDNQFSALTNEMEQFAADALESRETEVNQEFAEVEQRAESVLADIRRELSQTRSRVEEMIAAARRDGVTIEGFDTYQWTQAFRHGSYSLPSKTAALAEARKANHTLIRRTNLTIERQRLGAQRRILLSSLGEEAQAVLDSIPSAQQMMVAAQADDAAAQIEGSN